MSVKIKPTSVIKAHIGIEPNGKAQKYFASLCAKKMDKYVPLRSGELRSSGLRNVTANSITYDTPYAHYQYIGILYVDPDTGSSYAKKDAIKVATNKKLEHHIPGTGPYWDRRLWSAEKDNIVKQLQKYIDRG